MDKEIGFGIVGCGVIMPFHLYGIAQNRDKGARLAAVCDSDEKKAGEASRKNNVRCYTDYKKFLEDPEIGVVCLCTPSSLHSGQAIEAARAGKHVLTEKPMAITVKAAEEMIRECRKAGVKLGVIFQKRFHENSVRIKKALGDNELGRIVLSDIYMKFHRSQEYYDSAGWRGTWEFDGGGALMNQGIHQVDLLQWLMGDVEEIFGYAEHLVRKIEVEDTSAAVLRFRNGAMGVIEGTTSVYPPTLPARIEIHGDKGSIMLEGDVIARWDVMGKDGSVLSRAGEVKKEIEQMKGQLGSTAGMSMEGHRKQIADFIESIKTGREPMINGEEGKKSLEIILGIYESARTKKPVKL